MNKLNLSVVKKRTIKKKKVLLTKEYLIERVSKAHNAYKLAMDLRKSLHETRRRGH